MNNSLVVEGQNATTDSKEAAGEVGSEIFLCRPQSLPHVSVETSHSPYT